jgi:hypothetical protein
MFLVRPATVVNGTINPDGSVKPSAAGLKSMSLNGVFSSRFRAYEIQFYLYFNASDGSALRLRAGGTDYTGNNYTDVSVSGTTPGAASVNANNAINYVPLAAISATQHFGVIRVSHPATTVAGQVKTMQSRISTAFNMSDLSRSGALINNDAVAFDGFTLYSASATGAFDENASYIRVYGLR